MFSVCDLCTTFCNLQVAMMAVLVGIQVPWVAILTMCQLYQVPACIVLYSTHCWLAAFWAKDFLHIGFCNSIRQVYSEIDSMIGYLS